MLQRSRVPPRAKNRLLIRCPFARFGSEHMSLRSLHAAIAVTMLSSAVASLQDLSLVGSGDARGVNSWEMVELPEKAARIFARSKELDTIRGELVALDQSKAQVLRELLSGHLD